MPTLQIGEVKPKQIYYGSDKIKEAWLGNLKLWSSSVPTLVTVGRKGKVYYSLDMTTWINATVLSGLVNNAGRVTITNDGNKFVLLTIYNGTIYSFYSEDGINWTSVTPVGMAGEPTSIEYKQGIFVASSTGGLYYSYNGVNWQRTITNHMNRVKYLNGRFLAVGASGKSYYSFDGINWTAMSISNAIPGDIATATYLDVTYGNNCYIMTSPKDDANTNNTLVSYDGFTWSKVIFPYNSIYSFTCGKGIFVGAMYGDSVSEKGLCYQTEANVETRWIRLNSSTALLQVKYIVELGRFIAVGDRTAYYSLDGVSWTIMTGLNTEAYVEYWETSYKE